MLSIKNIAQRVLSSKNEGQIKLGKSAFPLRQLSHVPIYYFQKRGMTGSDNMNKASRMDQDFQKQLEMAHSLKNLLDIYSDNQEKVTPFNFYFFAREIQTRFYSENPKMLKNNPKFEELLVYIESNIHKMPPYTQVEVLTVVRKSYQNGHIEEPRVMNLARDIDRMLYASHKRGNHHINPKLISQAHLDLVQLGINQEHWLDILRAQLNDQMQAPYFTSQAIFNIFKSTEFYHKRKFSDFFYALGAKSISIIKEFDADRLCSMFMFVSRLQLHYNTSHLRLPQVILVLKDEIMLKLEENFKPTNGINILMAYTTAPHTLDTTLLEKVIKKMIFYQESGTLSVRQRLLFLENMSKMREGFKLTKEQIAVCYKNLRNKIEFSELNPSMCLQTLESMYQQDYVDADVIAKVEAELLKNQNIGFTMLIKNVTLFLKLKHDATALRSFLFKRLNNPDTILSLQKLLELIYIFNYEIKKKPKDHLQYSDTVSKLTEQFCSTIRESLNEPRNNTFFLFALDVFGKNYSAQKTQPFKIISDQFYEIYIQLFDQFDMNQKSNSLFNVCNWNIFGDKWSKFISKTIQEIDNEELISWIFVKYHQDQQKIYPKTDLILQLCTQNKKCKVGYAFEKIRFVLQSPYLSLYTRKGTPHPLLQELFDGIDVQNTYTGNITFSMLIKAHRQFEQLNVTSSFFVQAMVKDFEENKEKYLSNTNEFFASEIAQFFIQQQEQIIKTGLKNETNEIIVAIKKFLDEKFEDSQQNFGLSFLTKYVEITAWVTEENLMKIQDNELQFLAGILIEKLQVVKQENHINQSLNAVLLLAILEARQKIQLDLLSQEFMFGLFSKCLDTISVQGFVGYLEGMRMLRFFKLQQQNQNNLQQSGQPNDLFADNEDRKLLTRYFRKIEYFYISKNLGKLPYVVTEFAMFFSTFKTFYPQPQIYNKLLGDIVFLFRRFKIQNIKDITRSIANVKLNHPQVLFLIYQHFQNYQAQYRSSYQDMIWSFAQLGYIHEENGANKNFTKKTTKDLSSSSDDEDESSSKNEEMQSPIERFVEQSSNDRILYHYRMLWSMIFYNLQNNNKEYLNRLFNEMTTFMQQNQNKISFLSIQYHLDVISYILLSEPALLEQCSSGKENILKISKDLIQIILSPDQRTAINERQKPLVDLLKEKDRNDIKTNHVFEDTMLIADIFMEQSRTIILLDTEQNVNFDQQTLSGLGQMRKRLFKKMVEIKNKQLNPSETPYRLININSWKFKNIGEKKEDQINYLIKQSVPL